MAKIDISHVPNTPDNGSTRHVISEIVDKIDAVEQLNGTLDEFTIATLPPAADNQGRLVIITDNIVGGNSYAVVVSNGTTWTLTTGVPVV